MVGSHVLNTGHGRVWADRFPEPRALLAETVDNFQFYGRPEFLSPEEIAPMLLGFIDCPPSFDPLVRAACPDAAAWDRVVYQLDRLLPVADPAGAELRRLAPVDAPALASLSEESGWVIKTWGGATGGAASGTAWGAFVDGMLASLACTFFMGTGYEDLGVVTEPGYRGRGLSAACASALCQDVLSRGKHVSWNTSPDNRASIRVAEKVGFRFARNDRLWVAGIEIPRE